MLWHLILVDNRPLLLATSLLNLYWLLLPVSSTQISLSPRLLYYSAAASASQPSNLVWALRGEGVAAVRLLILRLDSAWLSLLASRPDT